jgi:hypothetical protein
MAVINLGKPCHTTRSFFAPTRLFSEISLTHEDENGPYLEAPLRLGKQRKAIDFGTKKHPKQVTFRPNKGHHGNFQVNSRQKQLCPEFSMELKNFINRETDGTPLGPRSHTSESRYFKCFHALRSNLALPVYRGPRSFVVILRAFIPRVQFHHCGSTQISVERSTRKA